MPEGHDTTIEVSNIMSFVLYTQILKQSVLKPASPGITLRTLPLVPSPTGPHPERGDSGVCMCIHVCLVWYVFPTAFIVPHHLPMCRQPSPIRLYLDMDKGTYEVGRFLPNWGSNSGRQISGPVLYRLSYSVLIKWRIECPALLKPLLKLCDI